MPNTRVHFLEHNPKFIAFSTLALIIYYSAFLQTIVSTTCAFVSYYNNRYQSRFMKKSFDFAFPSPCHKKHTKMFTLGPNIDVLSPGALHRGSCFDHHLPCDFRRNEFLLYSATRVLSSRHCGSSLISRLYSLSQ